MIQKLQLLLVLFLVFSFTQQEQVQYVPIQDTYDGLTLGDPSAPMHLEAFYDLMCPDSTWSNQQLNEVFKQIDFSNQNQVRFTIHILPLPYHYNAFYWAIGYRLLNQKYSLDQQKEFIDLILNNQEGFVNTETADLTKLEIFNKMATFVSSKLSFIQKDEFTNALKNNNYNQQARSSGKFALGQYTFGTPAFQANGVLIQGAEEYNVDDWKKFLSEYTDLQM